MLLVNSNPVHSYRERSLRYQLDRRLDGPQSSSKRNIGKMNAIELHSSGLIGTASHPDMQKIRIIEFFFENGLHWWFEVWLFNIYSMYLRLNLSTMPDLEFWKP